MLILTRKVGQRVVIGDEVAITVLGIMGGTVRLGITAPRRISVNREEVHARIRAERRIEAADGAVPATATPESADRR